MSIEEQIITWYQLKTDNELPPTHLFGPIDGMTSDTAVYISKLNWFDGKTSDEIVLKSVLPARWIWEKENLEILRSSVFDSFGVARDKGFYYAALLETSKCLRELCCVFFCENKKQYILENIGLKYCGRDNGVN